MNPNNPCIYLKELFEEIPSTKRLKKAFSAITETGSLTNYSELQMMLEQRRFFLKKYKEFVSTLLCEWYGDPIFASKISFEENGRVVIDGNLDLHPLRVRKKRYFPTVIRKINGSLGINEMEIRHLDFLEEAGELHLWSHNIWSLDRLKKVSGTLDLEQTSIIELPELVEVGTLMGESAAVKSLPSLKKADVIYLPKSRIKQMPNLRLVVRSLNINRTKIKALPSLVGVGSDFLARESQLEDLSSLKLLGNGFFTQTNLRSLPELGRVYGSLEMTLSENFESMNKLKQVDGSLRLVGTKVESLPELMHVGLDLEATDVETLESIPKIKHVGSALSIEGTSLRSLPVLKRVLGPLVFGSLVEDDFQRFFPKLKKVGENMSGVSIFCSSVTVQEQLKKLKDLGVIEIAGRIESR